MSQLLENIAETKRSLIEQLEQAEAELLGAVTELEESKSQLNAKILSTKDELESVRREKARLSGSNGHFVAGNGKLAEETSELPDAVASIPPEIERDVNRKPGTIEAVFCDTHGLPLKKIDDYILVILFNMKGMPATIEETERLLVGAGYKTNASNFKSILYSAYARLKDSKLVTTDKRPGRTAYYKVTPRGSKQVSDQLSQLGKHQKNTVDVAIVLEALKQPVTLANVVEFVAKSQHLAVQDPMALSQAIQDTVKVLVANGQAKVAGRQDHMTLYQRL